MGREPNTNPLQEHQIQTVFALLHTGAILVGSTTTATMIRTFTPFQESTPRLAWSFFVRDWGFVLLAVPAIWIAVTISLERSERFAMNQHWSIVTGFLVLGALSYLLLGAAVRPGTSLIQIAE